MDGRAWQAIVHGAAKSWTWLSHYHLLLTHIIFSYHYCIKIIVKMIWGLNYIFPSGIYIFFFLAVYWVSSGKEPKRHGFDPWVVKIPWRSKCYPIPAFLPGKSHGQRSPEDYSPWGPKELDTTKHLSPATILGINHLNSISNWSD